MKDCQEDLLNNCKDPQGSLKKINSGSTQIAILRSVYIPVLKKLNNVLVSSQCCRSRQFELNESVSSLIFPVCKLIMYYINIKLNGTCKLWLPVAECVADSFYILRVRSFGVIWIRISDPRSVWIAWCIKETGESMTRVDSPVPLMHHDPDRPWITDPDPDHPKRNAA